jgi:hypothetical protein
MRNSRASRIFPWLYCLASTPHEDWPPMTRSTGSLLLAAMSAIALWMSGVPVA